MVSTGGLFKDRQDFPQEYEERHTGGAATAALLGLLLPFAHFLVPSSGYSRYCHSIYRWMILNDNQRMGPTFEGHGGRSRRHHGHVVFHDNRLDDGVVLVC